MTYTVMALPKVNNARGPLADETKTTVNYDSRALRNYDFTAEVTKA